MRILPQRGFSRARRRTSSCTSRGIRGLPGVRRCLLLQLQYCRQAVYCQRITVSGRTSARADCHPGHIRESQDQNRRSAGWSLGRRCWRRGRRVAGGGRGSQAEGRAATAQRYAGRNRGGEGRWARLDLPQKMVPQGWSICLIPSTVQIRMAFCHPTANTMMKSCARRLSLRKALRPRLRLVLQS